MSVKDRAMLESNPSRIDPSCRLNEKGRTTFETSNVVLLPELQFGECSKLWDSADSRLKI